MSGYPEPVLIDYLAAIVGVDSKEISRSAVTIEFQGEPLRVLHPIQLLQSKIWNLYRLSEKRTPEGIEQARLAIGIVAAFIERAQLHKRELLKAIEAVGRFAATAPARYARKHFGLDCLQAIPSSVLKKGVPPRQNSCRSDMILNLGAIRTKDGSVRGSIQEQSGGAVVAAGERQCWRGGERDRSVGADIGEMA